MVRLMQHPAYREAQATDDHWMPILFAAGAAGHWDDEAEPNVLAAETWELVNMCNSQFTFGTWQTSADREVLGHETTRLREKVPQPRMVTAAA